MRAAGAPKPDRSRGRGPWRAGVGKTIRTASQDAEPHLQRLTKTHNENNWGPGATGRKDASRRTAGKAKPPPARGRTCGFAVGPRKPEAEAVPERDPDAGPWASLAPPRGTPPAFRAGTPVLGAAEETRPRQPSPHDTCLRPRVQDGVVTAAL